MVTAPTHQTVCAEFLAVVRALEECRPKVIVSTCKGVVKAKGRNRDLDSWRNGSSSLSLGLQIMWMGAHQTQAAVALGRISAEDHDNGQADILANLGTESMDRSLLMLPGRAGPALPKSFPTSGDWWAPTSGETRQRTSSYRLRFLLKKVIMIHDAGTFKFQLGPH
eukprot:4306536-Amphidinium_carterae.2